MSCIWIELHLTTLRLIHKNALNKRKLPVAPHSSILAWKIPWTEEPGKLQSMGSLRIGHDGVTSLSLFTFMHWRRKWQPTPVSLPGESQGQGSLVGCRLWGRTESDTTEAISSSSSSMHSFRVWNFKLDILSNFLGHLSPESSEMLYRFVVNPMEDEADRPT